MNSRRNHFVVGTIVFVVDVAVFLYHDLVDPGQIVDFDCHPVLSLAERGAGVRDPNSCHLSQYHQGTPDLVALSRDGQYHL